MTEKKNNKYPINKDTYDRGVKLFNLAEEKLGINIHVHDDHDAIADGQIFLFNHYARFETVIPPYIFYKHHGVFTRSVADKYLFDNEKFANMLIGGGAVPNNAEGLLPFMAAEILRGRKVVIFPEGGMIKDRRVMDEKGQYRIFSSTAETYRKHHKGAAILALTLDLFKRRILDLHDNNDTARLEHWRTALELESIDKLLTEARKPTQIVPSTITFYPMRIRENALSKMVDRFMKKASPSFMEEMIVEGNILLRDTDMDIRFGKPLETHQKWHWWEKLLLNKYFMGVDKLDDLFSLRHNANSFAEQLLARCISKESDIIRDLYMERIYDGLTVNMAHVAAAVIHRLLDKNIHKIPCEAFHKHVYRTIKVLQATPTVHLHKTIKSPRCFRTILENQCTELKRFIDLCTRANLIRVHEGHYSLMPKLQQEHDSRRIRLENPVKVAFNEAEPIEELKDAITNAFKRLNEETPETFACERMENEEIIYEDALTHFQQEKYDTLNKRETATQSGKPFLIAPPEHTRTGVLMVHGLLSTPAEYTAYADELAQKGICSLAIRLDGHGTSPYDLKNATHESWMADVYRGYNILAALVDKVIIVGFSTGGVLALSAAAELGEKVSGVVTICAPTRLRDNKVRYVGLVHHASERAQNIGLQKLSHALSYVANNTAHPHRNYQTTPIKAVVELKRAIKTMKRNLANITAPVCIIQSSDDTIVHPESAAYLYDNINADHKEIQIIPSNRHALLAENVANTQQLVTEFIEAFCDNNHKGDTQA